MENRPLVSIITIFFNAENFIQETVESVIAQTYPNWELLLIDDGSTDKSRNIAFEYAKKYPQKIFWLEHSGHKNLGKSTSRNAGINASRGEYITFLDADDVFHPQKLETQLSAMKLNPDAGMVYGQTLYWFSWTRKPSDMNKDFISKLGLLPGCKYNPPVLIEKFLNDSGTIPCICSILVRKNILTSVGGFEETIQYLYEDQVLLFKICLNTKVLIEDNCNEKYRQHPKSSSAVAIKERIYHPILPNPSRHYFLIWLKDYISQIKTNNENLDKILNKQLRYSKNCGFNYLILPLIYFYKLLKESLITRLNPIIKFPRNILSEKIYMTKTGNQKKNTNINFGDLRKVQPVSFEFGFDRGTPIDRYYIEKFLNENYYDIKGSVLEIGDDFYSKKFGGEKISKQDILHYEAGNPAATIIADLTSGEQIPSNRFDCFICTQTLHLIFDVQKAIETIYRILKPGGVLLATFPGISQISNDRWASEWQWGFTFHFAESIFGKVFGAKNITVQSLGNTLSSTAFLYGLVVSEFDQKDLDYKDEKTEMLLTVRAVKNLI